MTRISYKTYWTDDYERNREFFEDLVDPFRNWDRRDGHGDWAAWFLSSSLAAAYADAPAEIVRKFASAAVDVVDRAVTEDVFQTGKLAKGAFPRNRAVALRTRAYAQVLLGQSLPTDDLAQASRDFETRALTMWDHQYEAYYLNGVRAALIAGDHQLFTRLLTVKRQFKCHEDEYGVLRGLVDYLPHASTGPDAEFRDRFRSLFDRYRNPEFKPDIYLELEIIRFELGAIWYLFFSQTRAFSWHDVIAAVSE